MADATNSRLDLSTPEKARKALYDLQAEQKRLKSSNRDLLQNVEQKGADLAAIQKRLVEFENRGGRTTSSNAAMSKYQRPDGSVRARGEDTRERAWMPGLLEDAPVCDWQEELQTAVNDYTLVKSLSSKGQAPKCLARVREIARKAPAEVSKIFTDGVSGSGEEWIPDEMLPTLERNLTAERRLAGLFPTMNLPRQTTLLPYLSVGFRPYIKASAAADDPAQYTASSMTTEQRTISATGFSCYAQVADDADEDSVIAVMPTVQSELLQALLDGEEDAIVNGDLGSHQDSALASWDIRSRWGTSGLGGSADHRRAWLGLRAAAMDISGANTDMSGSLTTDEILANRAKLDSPHGTQGSLILIVSPEVYFKKILAADEVQTVEKIGIDRASIRTGNLGEIYGMPIVVSEFMSADLPTTGLYTAGGATSSALIVNKDRWRLGVRRGSSVEIDKDITRGVHRLVTTVRETFFTVDASTKKNLHLAFNITVT
jgi:HK97 family phage major capsid protein